MYCREPYGFKLFSDSSEDLNVYKEDSVKGDREDDNEHKEREGSACFKVGHT